MGLGRLQATDQPHVPLLAHGVAGGPEDLASPGLVLAARGTGGLDDPMGRRPHGGGKQHLSTGHPLATEVRKEALKTTSEVKMILE